MFLYLLSGSWYTVGSWNRCCELLTPESYHHGPRDENNLESWNGNAWSLLLFSGYIRSILSPSHPWAHKLISRLCSCPLAWDEFPAEYTGMWWDLPTDGISSSYMCFSSTNLTDAPVLLQGPGPLLLLLLHSLWKLVGNSPFTSLFSFCFSKQYCSPNNTAELLTE